MHSGELFSPWGRAAEDCSVLLPSKLFLILSGGATLSAARGATVSLPSSHALLTKDWMSFPCRLLCIPTALSCWGHTGTLVRSQHCSSFTRVSRISSSLLCPEHYPRSYSHSTLKKQPRKPAATLSRPFIK